MRRRFFGRRLPAALVLGLVWLSLTASVEAPRILAPPSLALPSVVTPSGASPPVSCVGTLFDFRANTLHLNGWPKLIVTLDVTRADRCAGPFGRSVARLHGFMVLTRDRMAVRTHLRGAQPSYWLQLCQLARPNCLDVYAVVRWRSPQAEAP
jgi:hypothetical protein